MDRHVFCRLAVAEKRAFREARVGSYDSNNPFSIKQVGGVSGREADGRIEIVRREEGGRSREGNSPPHNSELGLRQQYAGLKGSNPSIGEQL